MGDRLAGGKSGQTFGMKSSTAVKDVVEIVNSLRMDLFKEINSAYKRIGPHILNTPFILSHYLSELNEGAVYLKLESEQHTGSFKARGALNKILKTPEKDRSKGFLTASTGNHAQGFARAISISGSRGIIYLPLNAQKSKIEVLRHYDVELQFFGQNSLETELFAKEKAKERGMIWISPYNDWDVIAGQGTIGLEMSGIGVNLDSVLGCIGGGGMMSGIASWFEYRYPNTQVIGCLPENAPEMYLSVEKGEVVFLEEFQETLSDGSAGGLEEGAITFDICKELISDYILVSESEIASAITQMIHVHHKIIEGSAGVALASFLKDPMKFRNQNVGIIICGSNISIDKLKSVLQL